MPPSTASHTLSLRLKLLVCVFLMAPWAALADTYSFTALPADVTGPAGSTVGWGYTISNASTAFWLVPTTLNFTPLAASAGVFQHGSPNSLFDFPAIAPGVSVSLGFDPINLSGLYELTWDASAPAGFVDSGFFDLSGDWWTGDPSAGGNMVSAAPDESAPYSATVSGAPSVAEPSTTSLLALIAALILFRKTRLGINSFYGENGTR